jgi:hypothetical protein
VSSTQLIVRRLVLPPDSCGDEIHATLQQVVLQLQVLKDTPHKDSKESEHMQSEEADNEHASII